MKLKEKVNHFAVAHYKKIPSYKIISGDFSLNNRACHYNAVAAVRAGRADKVYLVWAGGSNGVIHFINSKGGKFFDETWHSEINTDSYRIIREIDPSEFDRIYDVLVSAKHALIQAVGSPLDKIRSKFHLHKLI